MESFNFGAFDPTIGARIAAIPQEAQKQQTANMLQAMQMQGVMNQNELAQSQMRTAKRAEEGQTLLGKAYGGLDFSGAGEGGVPGQSPFAAMKSQVIKSLTASNRPDLIPSELAKLTEMEHKANVNEELKGKLAEQARKAVDSELTSFTKNAFKVTGVPSLTTHLRAFYDNPLLGKIAARFKTFDQALNDDIKQISTPEGLRQWQAENANLTGKELTDLLLKVTTTTSNLGDVSRETQRGGMGQIIGVPVDTPMGMTPGQVRAAADAKLLREQSERHFQAGGYTYDLDRGIRIDRNGIATPLMQQAPAVGGAAVGGGVSANAPVSGGIPTGRGSAAGLVPLGPKQTRIAPNELRDEVNALTKDFRVVQDAHTKIKNVANTGAGDMSLLYSFIKLLDPASVVRESEFAAAAQSGSYGERVQGAVNRALTGQRLPDSLRQDFIREADNLYKSQKAGTDRVIKHYTGIAERAGLNPQDIIFPYAAPEIVIPEQAPAGAVRLKGK